MGRPPWPPRKPYKVRTTCSTSKALTGRGEITRKSKISGGYYCRESQGHEIRSGSKACAGGGAIRVVRCSVSCLKLFIKF